MLTEEIVRVKKNYKELRYHDKQIHSSGFYIVQEPLILPYNNDKCSDCLKMHGIAKFPLSFPPQQSFFCWNSFDQRKFLICRLVSKRIFMFFSARGDEGKLSSLGSFLERSPNSTLKTCVNFILKFVLIAN